MSKKIADSSEVARSADVVRKYLPEGSRVRGVVVSVSRSGMSRRIRFYAGSAGDTHDLTYEFAKLTGWSLDDRGLLVQGCGMDMVFHTVYTVSRTVYGNGYAIGHR